MAKRSPVIHVERGKTFERTALAGAAKSLTQPRLHRILDPIVRPWLAAACAWTGDEMGDYRFLVFWTNPAPDVQVYIQFWSEPGEPVLCEVSSGRWNPPADKWLEGRRSQKIASYGFVIGGEAENFQRHFDIRTPADIEHVAKFVAAIFFNAFDYRGETPIEAKLTHDGRAESQLTFEGFTPDEIMKVFAGNGFRVEEAVDDDDEPVVPSVLRCRKRGLTTVVELHDHAEDDTYGRMHLSAEIPLSRAQVSEMRRRDDQPPDAVPIAEVTVMHSFIGGVTLEWLIARIQEWDGGLAEHKQEVRGMKKGPRRAQRPPGETVH